MNFLKLRYYIEIISIATGIVLLICVIPIQVWVDGKIRMMTVVCGALLWYKIIFYNVTFRYLLDKWLEK